MSGVESALACGVSGRYVQHHDQPQEGESFKDPKCVRQERTLGITAWSKRAETDDAADRGKAGEVSDNERAGMRRLTLRRLTRIIAAVIALACTAALMSCSSGGSSSQSENTLTIAAVNNPDIDRLRELEPELHR